MKTLIIHYPDDMGATEAMQYAAIVTKQGRVSENVRGGVTVHHFCWVTTFKGGIYAYTRQKKSNDSADSIEIRRTK